MNRTYERAAPLGESGATLATCVAECVHDASVVITMLFDTAATLEVKPELLESMNPDSVWVQAATVGPGWSAGRGTPGRHGFSMRPY